MNDRIQKLAAQAELYAVSDNSSMLFDIWKKRYTEKFAELVVEECRAVIATVYRNTPLEFCGPLLVADSELAEHFYGVEQ